MFIGASDQMINYHLLSHDCRSNATITALTINQAARQQTSAPPGHDCAVCRLRVRIESETVTNEPTWIVLVHGRVEIATGK